MKRRSFLRGLLAIAAAPITVAKAIAGGLPVRDTIPMLDIKISTKAVLASRRTLRYRWSILAEKDLRQHGIAEIDVDNPCFKALRKWKNTVDEARKEKLCEGHTGVCCE